MVRIRVYLDQPTITTAPRLAGVRALLLLLQDAVPEYANKEHRELNRFAREQDLEAGEYFMERDLIDHKFNVWLPRFAAYSVITMLWAVVEVQLYECVKHVERDAAESLSPRRRQSSFDLYAEYLKKHRGLHVKKLKEWRELSDLRSVRDIVAHRLGTRGQGARARNIEAQLERQYTGDLKFQEARGEWPGQVWISLPLCERFTASAEAFLEKVVAATSVPSTKKSA